MSNDAGVTRTPGRRADRLGNRFVATARTVPAPIVVAAAASLSGLSLLATAGQTNVPARVLDVLVGWTFVIGGLAVRRSNSRGTSSGLLMTATGLGWLVGGVVHRGPLVQLLLTDPTGRSRPGRFERLAIAGAYADGILESVIPVAIATIGLSLTLGAACLLMLLRTSGQRRRRRLVAGVAGLSVSIVLAGEALLTSSGARLGDAPLLVYEVLLVIVALGVAADRSGGVEAQGAVTGLVVDLGRGQDAGTLRDRLASALGDPSLVIGYAFGPAGSFIDETGGDVELPSPGSGRRVTPIVDRGATLAVLVHDAVVLDSAPLVGSVGAAMRLAVDNVRHRAEIDILSQTLAASRRRIVDTADNQRRRVERELSVGALARLARVRNLMSEAMGEPRLSAEAAAVQDQLRVAENELTAFARGVYPATLLDAGLKASIAELTAAGAARVSMDITEERLPAAVEAAAYFICAEALANASKHAHATRVNVEATIVDHALRVRIIDNGVGGADPAGSGLRGLTARVGAVGGRLTIASPAGAGTSVEAEIPT
jgi:signal transduction histidine kinase